MPGGASNDAPSHRAGKRRFDPLFLASGASTVCIRSTMAQSSPMSENASLSPYLVSKGACEAEKHKRNGAEKVHQVMPRASNNALGRIDTMVRVPKMRHGGFFFLSRPTGLLQRSDNVM